MDKLVLNAQNIQKANRLKVLNFIRENKMVRRPQIAEQTGLSLSSVTNAVVHLMKSGFVTDNGVEHVDRVGRKADLLSFNHSVYRYICVHIGRKTIQVALTDLGMNSVAVFEQKLEKLDTQSVLETVWNIVKGNMMAEYDKVLAVGVTVSALILNDKLFSSGHRWEAFDIKNRLEEKLGKPTYIFNDTMIKAVGTVDAGRRNKNFLFVDLEGGIGAVLVQKGTVNRDIIGEVGHTTVCMDGDVCSCGNCGCLEAMCSPERIVKLSKPHLGDCTFLESVAAAEGGNRDIQLVFDECLAYLGIGLANLINILSPQEVVINISEFLQYEYVYLKTVEIFKKRLLPQLKDDLMISKIVLSDKNIKYGFAKCLCDEVFSLSYKAELAL